MYPQMHRAGVYSVIFEYSRYSMYLGIGTSNYASIAHCSPQMKYLAFYEYFDMSHMALLLVELYWDRPGNMGANPIFPSETRNF